MAGRPKGIATATAEKSKIKAVKKEKATTSPKKEIKLPEAVKTTVETKSDPQSDYIKSLQQSDPEIKPEKSLQEEAAELMQQKLKEAAEQQKNESNKPEPAIITSETPKTGEPNMPAILAKYEEKCNTPSDINQLLPYLRAVSDSCDHITEFGVRDPTSTYAFLAGNPKQLISYDIYRSAGVDEVESLAPNFKFVLGSTLEVEIEETDFLFVDTVHTATQLERELSLHAHKAKRFMGFHDITSFGQVGEYYEGINPEINCGRGLWAALSPFLQNNTEWKVDFQTAENNGLLILRRAV